MKVKFLFILILSSVSSYCAADSQSLKPETLEQITNRVGRESGPAYNACPFSALSKNYFSRFTRDPNAKADSNEVAIDSSWSIVISSDASIVTRTMAKDLSDFLKQMNISLPVRQVATDNIKNQSKAIILLDSAASGTPESFTITATSADVTIAAPDSCGLRDGVVKLADLMGLRQAPYLRRGTFNYKPRLSVRLGSIPSMGSMRDLVFMGFNAISIGGNSLYAYSISDAIPELVSRRIPGSLESLAQQVRDAKTYGLKTYCFINTRQKFDKNDPIFTAHPEIRGSLTWSADGQYTLCTEHQLVRRYLTESVQSMFKAAPDLDGILIIVGGEGFYHCFMRPYGVDKGHTNCSRCEPLGAETVVANLCNCLADAARQINPRAEVLAWPYSAFLWSADSEQLALIKKLRPGVALFTEIEKDEYVHKSDGVNKLLWDYSIDLIGPGKRAKDQIAACKAVGIHVYLKSEPELSFEAPRLPNVPCMDRWADRAIALSSCGADGAFVFPAFRACYGTSTAEIGKFFWWDPVPQKDALLAQLASRIAGPKAGSHLKNAWKYVSEAIDWSPELPTPYYTGPYYLGPAQPMCADPKVEVPQVFYGYYLYLAEMQDSEGLKRRPTFYTSPPGNVPVFTKFYSNMESLLAKAVEEIDKARLLVPARCKLTFEAESSSIRWFYHTARTQTNFYRSCQLRDKLLAIADSNTTDANTIASAKKDLEAWLQILLDEKANTAAALPVARADVRLDFYFGGDHTFSHTTEMLAAKLSLLEYEINTFLPALSKRCRIE